jgi:hypothetical protein
LVPVFLDCDVLLQDFGAVFIGHIPTGTVLASTNMHHEHEALFVDTKF